MSVTQLLRGRRGAVARWAALAVVAAALAAAAGVGWASSNQEHSARAVVLLHPLEGNAYSPGGRGDDLVNLATEAQVLRSDTVARAVLDELGETVTPAELLADVSVDVPPNTQLLDITARAGTSDQAVARAQAFAGAILVYRASRTDSAVAERSARLEELVATQVAERDSAGAELADLEPDAPARVLLEQQVQELTLQLGSLRSQLAAAQAVSHNPGQVVTPARVEATGVLARPAPLAAVLGGAAASVVLAVAVMRSGRGRPDPEDTAPGESDQSGEGAGPRRLSTAGSGEDRLASREEIA